MSHVRRSALAFATALAIGLPAVAAAQGSAAVDAALAAKGKTAWNKLGCGGCHGIGKTRAGPDLANVSERRSQEWLKAWLQNTKDMIANDSIGQALVTEWKGMKMPQFNVSDADVDGLLHYIAQESAKLAAKKK